MKRFKNRFRRWMNMLMLRDKLLYLFLLCVLLPLVVTDGFIIYNFSTINTTKQKHELSEYAEAVEYYIKSRLEYPTSTARVLSHNNVINNLLNTEYKSSEEYYDSIQEFKKNTIFGSNMGLDKATLTIYADNDTIINGGEFSKLSSIKNEKWYEYIDNKNENSQSEYEKGESEIAPKSNISTRLLFYYDHDETKRKISKRKVLFLSRLNMYSWSGCEKVLKIEMEYNSFVEGINKLGLDCDVYLCKGNKLLISNKGGNNVIDDYGNFKINGKVNYKKPLVLHGEALTINIVSSDYSMWNQMVRSVPLITALILLNIVLPIFMMQQIEGSITSRLKKLEKAFASVNEEKLKMLDKIEGEDEIANLSINYNHMARRINELIQTVYKDRLKEQEMDIARQNAELLALHSQINPHFLFNALESIRMHSILKGEEETAQMVERLAIMERNNVDWNSDEVSVENELAFVEAYLGLQKYRFGDRLNYEIYVDDELRDMRIPRLTVVTFVENACVHGVENKKGTSWIFVRIYMEGDEKVIEIEDTGCGMNEEAIHDILDKMENADIDRLKSGERVGIINASLRLKMMNPDKIRFYIESEEDEGTIIQIFIK